MVRRSKRVRWLTGSALARFTKGSRCLRGSLAWMSRATGFVLIQVKAGQERAVYDILSQLPEVVEMHGLFGEYEIIAKLETDHLDNLGHAIVEKVRSIPGIVATKTFVSTQFGPERGAFKPSRVSSA